MNEWSRDEVNGDELGAYLVLALLQGFPVEILDHSLEHAALNDALAVLLIIISDFVFGS